MAASGAAFNKSGQISEVERHQLLRPWPSVSFASLGILVALFAVYVWGFKGTNASPGTLIDGIPNIWDFVSRMAPPVFETEVQTLQTPSIPLFFGVEIPRIGLTSVTFQFPIIIYDIIETIQMAVIGSTGAIIISIPFALLAARNIAPHPAIYQTTRMLLNINRAIPDIIFALIFVAAVGLGPFGGVLAIAVGSVGFMGKVYAEAIEAIDPEQVKAIRATGASRAQTVVYSVFPQAMPMITSYSLLLFESNVRSATILGLVGAGGVGFTITKYMSLFQYDKLLGALIFIVLMVTIVDRFSDYVRGKLI
jgi:phosphonate transport system permease protein